MDQPTPTPAPIPVVIVRPKPYRTIILLLVLAAVSAFGFFWWRSGFTLDFSTFFASGATVTVFPDTLPAGGGDVNVSWSASGAMGCGISWGGSAGSSGSATVHITTTTTFSVICGGQGTGQLTDSKTVTVAAGTPPPVSTTPPSGTAPPPPVSQGCPANTEDQWVENGVTVCLLNDTTFVHPTVCTTVTDQHSIFYHVLIINNSTQGIYSKTQLFACPLKGCGAIANNSGPGCTTAGTTGIRSGPGTITAGNQAEESYTFTAGPCGEFQLDDTWRGTVSGTTFVLGKTINTNADCVVATTPPPATSVPPPPPLACAPLTQSVNVNQTATITATGGTGTYAWFAPGGTPASGAGGSLGVAYSVAGNKTVTVTSGGSQVTCAVVVTAPVTHLACVSNACTAVSGAGTNQCATNADCVVSNSLACAPASQNKISGQSATVNASGGTPAYTWQATSGVPATGTGSSFATTFTNTTVPSQVFPVKVTDSVGGTATCNITVSCPAPSCANPPAGCTVQGGNACTCGTIVCGNPIACTPQNQTVNVQQAANFTVTGGTGPYSWIAVSANTTTGSGSQFSTAYNNGGSYQVNVIDSQNQSAQCAVTVNSTSSLTPALGIQKLVRNVTQNGAEADSVNANPTDTVEFSLRVSSSGTSAANDVIARDALPSGLTYQPGTTTIDSISAADGIISTGLNLGNLVPGRTVIVRFRATVAAESFFSVGSTMLVNTGYARGSNVPEVSDPAFVNVVRNQPSLTMTLTKMGRNLTRGQTTGEFSPVTASPNDTIEFVMHIGNTSLGTLNNVIVRDILPQGVTYVAGTARLGGNPIADTIVLSGVNIGSIAPAQQVIVTFSGRIAPGSALPVGTTTLINTVQATADTVPMLTAQLPIIITNSVIIPPPVSTGPGDTTALALIISAIITLLYVGYTSTDTYRRREVTDLAHQAGREKDLFNFRK